MKTRLSLTAAFVLLLNACASNGGSGPPSVDPAEPNPKPPVPVPVPFEQTVQDPEAVQWEWTNEQRAVEMTNVGWSKGETVYDYTQIASGGDVLFIYREFTTNEKSLDAATGIETKIEISRAAWKWNSSVERLLKARIKSARRWSNRTSMHAVSEALDKWLVDQTVRCTSAPEAVRPPNVNFAGLGNVLIRSDDMFYADRWLGAVNSALEVEWSTLKVIGVATLLTHASMFSFSQFGELEPYPELRLTAGAFTGSRIEGASHTANVEPYTNFRLACERAYEELKQKREPVSDEKASALVSRYLGIAREGSHQISISEYGLYKEKNK